MIKILWFCVEQGVHPSVDNLWFELDHTTNRMKSLPRRQSRSLRSSQYPPLFRTITWMLIVLTSSFLSFYVGLWTGIQAKAGGEGPGGKDEAVLNAPNFAELQRKAEELAKQIVTSQLTDLCKKLSSSIPKEEPPPSSPNDIHGPSPLFSNSLSHFVQGLARVSKGDLMQTYALGVPPNANTENLDALILYTKKLALPSDGNAARAARHEDPTKPLPLLSATAATENCDTMNVILIDNLDNTRQCFALVGEQYRSYHIQRWMRRPDVPMSFVGNEGKLDAHMPLKLTSRGWTVEGKQEFVVPSDFHVKRHQERLLTYLREADDIRSRLRQTLEKMKGKTVVVMTCNRGQSELLMNFACSSRARGFDLQNVIVFPTDMETKELAEGMGLATFYEETLMASIPKEEALTYGDEIFADIMFAKVLCVQLVNELGYDLLFQDVNMFFF